MKRLADYARRYNETYGVEVKPSDLVAQIVGHLLNTDRGYRAWRREALQRSVNGGPRIDVRARH